MSGPDVVVYGASAAGVIAAVAAAEAGASVTLVEPGSHVGGMVSGGLGWTDFGSSCVVGGLTARFHRLVADHYGSGPFGHRGPEPHVAEALFVQMLEKARVELRLGEPLTAVERGGRRISALETPFGRRRGAVFIDATYEGDVMAGAGVPYRVGREDRSLHGESWAGRQPAYRPGMHNFDHWLSPFVEDGSAELVAEVCRPAVDGRGWPLERLGEGDGALQAYQFRLCMTDRPGNALPLDEPPGYDPARFELLRRHLARAGPALGASSLMGLVPDVLPNGKCDVNSIGPFSLNVLDGSNRAYPDGDAGARRAVRDHHLLYTKCLLYYLRNDECVPEHIRTEMHRWSLCADEFADTEGWPHQLYIRDARRMVGAAVLTEHDLFAGAAPCDVVALGSYNIDIREIERTWRYLPEYFSVAAVFNEGYLSIPVAPYGISYRSLLPKEEDCENLLVPVCLSASHVAFGSARTEPTLMALGHASGTAAALAAITGEVPHRADVDRLQRRLEDDGQVLAVPR